MGARLSLLAPSAPTVALSSYIDVFEEFQYVELINNSGFLKTVKAIDKDTGGLVIIKVFLKPTDGGYHLNLKEKIDQITAESYLLVTLNNVLPWHKIVETDRAGYLVRQLLKTNIYDRLSLRPFLEPIEKSFITFQMLKIVKDIHESGIRHGDLKLENFLTTSWNWVMLTDFSNSTKPTYLPDDNPNQFSFYFDTSRRRVCYIAPERFCSTSSSRHPIDANNIKDNTKKVTDSMDLFSLGCVIAELNLDGDSIFSLAQLFKYKKEEYEPDMSGLYDHNVREIVKTLIQREPDKRPSAGRILDDYKSILFPVYFYDFLYEFMSDLNNGDHYDINGDENLSPSDIKINKIYDSFENISKYFHFDYPDSNTEEYLPNQPFIPLKLNLSGMPSNYRIKPSRKFKASDHEGGSLIVLNLVFSLMNSLKRPTSKIKAIELIIAFSEHISDECKLDRSLPYLCSILDEYVEYSTDIYQKRLQHLLVSNDLSWMSNVVSIALAAIVTLLDSCSFVTPINTLLIPEYLLPKLLSLVSMSQQDEKNNLIHITLASCLPSFAQVSKKFWLMSVALNNEVLKNIGAKDFRQTQAGESDDDLNVFNTLSVSKEQLDSDFERLAFTLLTHSDTMVKISLMNNILPLCEYFGVDKTNNLIVPHLLTYLNDTNYHLRLAFLSAVQDIGPFIGMISFEQYLLPLLIQSLEDPEQFVTLKILEILHDFVKYFIINPKCDFNALSIYKELLTNSLHLILLPNEWIRQSIISLVLEINYKLLDADRYCFLYPIIKRFLIHDITTISWNTLYPNITKPLSRKVYKMAIIWSLDSSVSLFWQQKNPKVPRNLEDKNISSKIGDYSKNVGKSIYITQDESFVSAINIDKRTRIPVSSEDKRWVLKLKSIGLDEKDLWKVYMLRNYILRANKPLNLTSSNIDQPVELRLTPRNVFFEVCYKTEPIDASSGVDRSVESYHTMFEQCPHYLTKNENESLVLPQMGRAKVSLQTIQANVLAELETNDSGSRPLPTDHHHLHSTKDNKSLHKVFDVNKYKLVTANMRHSYLGVNPYILSYLRNIDFYPTLDDFPEFAGYYPSPKQLINNDVWKPEGINIARIDTNSSSSEIYGLKCLAVCPTSEFFVTGSENGNISVWDVVDLERNSFLKHASLTLCLNSNIISLKFIPNRFVFCVATIDGQIRLIRVDVIRSKNKKISRYTKLAEIRCYHLNLTEDSFATDVGFCLSSWKSSLMVVTSNSKIIMLDILRMEKDCVMQNPLRHGAIQTFVIDNSQCWMLLGTTKGVLSLWDLRFKTLINSWKIKNESDHFVNIKKLILLPPGYKSSETREDTSYFAMIGDTQEADIIVWEVPSFQCQQVFSAHTFSPKVKLYSMVELKNESASVSDLVSGLKADFSIEDNGMSKLTTLAYYERNDFKFFITSTLAKRIIAWNILDIEKSTSLDDTNSVIFTKSQVTETLSINYEKVLGKDTHTKTENSPKAEHLCLFGSSKFHQDIITDIGILTVPFEMIVSIDRSGYINVFK